MQFESNMFSEAWSVLRRCKLYVGMAVLGEFVLTILKETTSFGESASIVPSILIWSFLAFAAHAEVLFGPDRDKTQDGNRVFGFAMRSFGLILVAAVPMLVVALLAGAGGLRLSSDPEVSTGLLILILIPILGLFALLVFSFAGTLLPAFVIDQGRGLGAALARGWRQFFWIAGRLLIGPGVIYTLSVLIVFVPAAVLPDQGTVLSESYVPNVGTTLGLLASYTVRSYATVMVAVILSRAFLRDTAMRGEAMAPAA